MDSDMTGEETIGSEFRRTWYVLHVKPRTEKRVMEALAALQVFRYLPLVKKVSRVQRRRVVRYLPVFPGYVFTRLNPDERRQALGTRMVVRVIEVAEPRRMIHQLRQVEHASKLVADLRVAQSFEAGERVRVVSGPLRGLEGQVVRRGAEATLVLSVDILGRALEASISPADLQRLPPSGPRARALHLPARRQPHGGDSAAVTTHDR